MYQALQITQPESGYRCDLTELDDSALPKSGSGKVMWRLLQEQEKAAAPQ